ncbi:MAG: HEAT repeat domain-containing protein [Planctomycetota bacterium]|nr:HEAT repeat domain-containing protein [Planctomycetota bacterium]
MRRLAVLLLLALPLRADGFNAGLRAQRLKTLEEAFAWVLNTPEDHRGAVWAEFAQKHGQKRIDALIHYRDKKLEPLFLILLEHEDARVRHRALLALAYCGTPDAVGPVRKLLAENDTHVRERAALTLRELVASVPPGDEKDPYVRRLLSARGIRAELPLPVLPQPGPAGLVRIPPPVLELRGGGGGGSIRARPMPPEPATRFAWPTLHRRLGSPEPPYGPDGIGVYAIAAGSVSNRYSYTNNKGIDLTIVHDLGGGFFVTVVYGGLSPRLFVERRERVAAGQPIGSVRAGYHAAAALDLRIHLGPARHARTLDVETVLARWHAWTAPLAEVQRPLAGPFKHVAQDVANQRYGKVYRQAVSIRNKAEPGSELHADAVYVATLIQQVTTRALKRARRRLEDGWPRAALDDLIAVARKTKGIPGRMGLVQQAERWQLDEDIAQALNAVSRLERATKRALAANTVHEARALIEPLQAELKDTCLKPRLEELMR